MATHVTHVEVVGKDAAKLQKFYSEAFGWALDTNNPEGYGMRQEESGISAGIGKSPDGGPGHVTFYVHADDAEATLKRVEKLGGKVIMPLTEVAPNTTIALFSDPEGHVVGLM